MHLPDDFTNHNLIAMMRMDSLRQAQFAIRKLGEVAVHLEDESHVTALDAFGRLDEDIQTLKTFLVRMVRLT